MVRRKGVLRQRNGANHIKTRKKAIRKTENKTKPHSELYDRGLTFKENLYFLKISIYYSRQNLGMFVDINKRVNEMTKVEKKDNIEVDEEIDLNNLKNG
jgi:hypothetical protein